MLDAWLLDVCVSAFVIDVSILRVTMLLHSLDIVIDWLYNENLYSINLKNTRINKR